MDRVLVTGACGQLGSELSVALAARPGVEKVIVSDISEPIALLSGLPYEKLDVLDANGVSGIVKKHGITRIFHLAAMLSAKAEENPHLAWRLNMESLINILEVSRKCGVQRVFWPSSIAAFGPNTPASQTPQYSVMDPNTIYGISKLSGELWCNYYFQQFGLDVRSLRYPGLISYKTPPGGGTTDYAVDIFYSALKGEEFRCFLKNDTRLPMMFMPDAVKAALDLMDASAEKIRIRTSYNVEAINFTPEQLAREITRHLPNFRVTYQPDYRQEIAASWPQSLDDSYAREDWSWQPQYDLQTMTHEMIQNLSPVNSPSPPDN